MIRHVAFWFLTLFSLPCWGVNPLSGHCQAIVITTVDWDSVPGKALLFERTDEQSPWMAASSFLPVVVGKKGLAWGIGLHPCQSDPFAKAEGDGKSPAGIFSIGTAFGFAGSAETAHLKIEYLPLGSTIEAVDDSNSAYYNCIVDSSKVSCDWTSSEHMSSVELYRKGFVINHNFPNPQPFKGSAIFFHLWRNDHTGTAGCTAANEKSLSEILSWLDQQKQPVLIQLPIKTYRALQQDWRLPPLLY